MFHIVVGFESHRKDSASEALYTGHDPEEVQQAVSGNLSRFGVIRVYKNPAWSKRYNQGDVTSAPEAAPAEAAPVEEPPAEEPPVEEPPAEEPPAEEPPAEEPPASKRGKK